MRQLTYGLVVLCILPLLTAFRSSSRTAASSPPVLASPPSTVSGFGRPLRNLYQLYFPPATSAVKSPPAVLNAQQPPKPNRNAVIRAINQGGRRISVEDTVSMTGMDSTQARKLLIEAAAATGAQLHVSDDGQILFLFPPSLNRKLIQNSMQKPLTTMWRLFARSLSYLTKASFSVTLFSSLFVLLSSLSVLLPSPDPKTAPDSLSLRDEADQQAGDNRENLLKNRLNNVRVYHDYREYGNPLSPYSIWGPSPFSAFYNKPHARGLDVGLSSLHRSVYHALHSKSGFFNTTMSYLFGVGDSNDGFEQAQLQAIARVIQDHKGVVIAEQLAPYLHNPPALTHENATMTDERFVLSILAALGGEPQLTENGYIAYTFPDLQAASDTTLLSDWQLLRRFSVRSAEELENPSTDDMVALLQRAGVTLTDDEAKLDKQKLFEKFVPFVDSQLRQRNPPAPALLFEQQSPFSGASFKQRVLAAGLGLVYLFCTRSVRSLLHQPNASTSSLGKYLPVLQASYPFLLFFTAGYNLLPAIRNFWNNRRNQAIDARNAVREQWAELLAAPTPQLRGKLNDARNVAMKSKTKRSKASAPVVSPTEPSSEFVKPIDVTYYRFPR